MGGGFHIRLPILAQRKEGGGAEPQSAHVRRPPADAAAGWGEARRRPPATRRRDAGDVRREERRAGEDGRAEVIIAHIANRFGGRLSNRMYYV